MDRAEIGRLDFGKLVDMEDGIEGIKAISSGSTENVENNLKSGLKC